MNKGIEALKNGGTILYPTDTIWGIGCDATDESACQKVLKIKERTKNKSFIILVDSFAMLERFIPEFQEVCYDLADFASRPLTIIYPNAKGLAPSTLAEDGSVGIRITNDPICQKLIQSIRKPIVSTSANLSGETIPTCFEEINERIKSEVDAIVEERTFERMTKASQIVKIGIDGKVEVLRR
tara:strand:- start:13137 stop:13685 length:549 start_codon:yes stop_codon:yes gene_type:complete